MEKDALRARTHAKEPSVSTPFKDVLPPLEPSSSRLPDAAKPYHRIILLAAKAVLEVRNSLLTSLNAKSPRARFAVTAALVFALGVIVIFGASRMLGRGGYEDSPDEFLYIYDLPDGFNAELLEEEPFWPQYAGAEATEVHIHRGLADAADIVVEHPEEASLFFVPVYISLFRALQVRRGLGTADADNETAYYVKEALRLVKDANPLSGFRDHFMVAPTRLSIHCRILRLLSTEERQHLFFLRPTVEAYQPLDPKDIPECEGLQQPSVHDMLIPPRLSALPKHPLANARPVSVLLPVPLKEAAQQSSSSGSGSVAEEALAVDQGLYTVVSKLSTSNVTYAPEEEYGEARMTQAVFCGCAPRATPPPCKLMGPITSTGAGQVGAGSARAMKWGRCPEGTKATTWLTCAMTAALSGCIPLLMGQPALDLIPWAVVLGGGSGGSAGRRVGMAPGQTCFDPTPRAARLPLDPEGGKGHRGSGSGGEAGGGGASADGPRQLQKALEVLGRLDELAGNKDSVRELQDKLALVQPQLSYYSHPHDALKIIVCSLRKRSATLLGERPPRCTDCFDIAQASAANALRLAQALGATAETPGAAAAAASAAAAAQAQFPSLPGSAPGSCAWGDMPRSLLDAGVARLKLCLPRSAPFALGTFLREGTVGRFIVFEAEVIHGAPAGSYPPREVLGKQTGEAAEAYVQMLVLLETVGSLEKSQKEWWGTTWSVDPINEVKLPLECEFWHGAGGEDEIQQPGPMHVTQAEWVTLTEKGLFYVLLHCPLPSTNERGLLTAAEFQVKLVPADPSMVIIHVELLPLCRVDGLRGETKERVASVTAAAAAAAAAMTEGGGSGAGTAGVGANAGQQVVAAGSVGASAGGVVGQADGGDDAVGMCMLPFIDHDLFAESVERNPMKSTQRVRELIDYYLLVGVRTVYFYDHYGEEYMDVVKPYLDSGAVVHVPFPMFSEVFYRKETYPPKPNRFPYAYNDMVWSYHCLMQGRIRNDKWMIMVDTHEFVEFPSGKLGMPIGSVLRELEEVVPEGGENREGDVGSGGGRRAVLVGVQVHRFQFFAPPSESEPVVAKYTKRCKPFMQRNFHSEGENRWNDRVIISPWRSLGGDVSGTRPRAIPAENILKVQPEKLKINFYWGNVDDCKYEWDKVDKTEVDDANLAWVADRRAQCWKEVRVAYTPDNCTLPCAHFCHSVEPALAD